MASFGALALGTAVFLLSKDTNDENDDHSSDESEQMTQKSSKLLSDMHTEERLHALLEMTHLEFTCIYVRNYNRLL